jgi:hypothetical protein
MTDSTGPKISSWAMTEWLSTLPNTVGSTYQPRSRPSGDRRHLVRQAHLVTVPDRRVLAVAGPVAPSCFLCIARSCKGWSAIGWPLRG